MLPRSTTAVLPETKTRPFARRARKSPPLADACRAVKASFPMRSAQNGASVQCADPVAGSSRMPSHGVKYREWKS